MDRFLERHRELITGSLSCFDRVIFKGCLHLNHPRAMEQFLDFHKVLYKDLKPFLIKQADRIKAHAVETAAAAGRPFQYLERPVSKEELARKIAERDGIREGLVSVFSCLEPCRTYVIQGAKGRPKLRGPPVASASRSTTTSSTRNSAFSMSASRHGSR